MILLTGGTGAVGRELIPLLASSVDDEIVAYANAGEATDPLNRWRIADSIQDWGRSESEATFDIVVGLFVFVGF